MINRRSFLQKAICTSVGIPLIHPLDGYGLISNSPQTSFIEPVQNPVVNYNYILSRQITAASAQIPDGKRIPFQWPVFFLPASTEDKTTTLHFMDMPASFTQLSLRLTVALDIREEKLIEVFLPQSGRLLGTIAIKYAYALQPFELQIPVKEALSINREGVGLRMIKGEQPAWFFSNTTRTSLANKGLQPHLLTSTPGKSLSGFYSNLFSLNSIQPFGWMEGCVMDGLYDLFQATGNKQALDALKSHVNLFFNKEKQLVYEDPGSTPADGKIYGIEGTLPFAVMAKLEPGHPSVSLMNTYYLARKAESTTIQDKDLTTEGCYTVAYPLAVSAAKSGNKELALLAIEQLQKRQLKLASAEAIYQRIDTNGKRSFCNWGRGVTWYLLGIVRTLAELKQANQFSASEAIADLEAEFKRAAQWALGHQNKDGLWYAYIDQPETGVDTSASAGIAAAMAIGIKHKYLPQAITKRINQTISSLHPYLTPDGFLTSVCQVNRGGEALQKNGYRVISQYASGMMAQLLAALPDGQNKVKNAG